MDGNFLITVGSQQLFSGDTWEINPYGRWSDNPLATWIETCNFRDWLYITDSIDVGITVYGRSTAQFSIWDEDDDWTYLQGQVVEIRDMAYNLLFGGVIENISEQRLLGPVTHKIHHVSCIDWNWIADKRLVYMAVENQHAGDIVTTIFNNILTEEGVTVGLIQEGALIPEFRAGYSTITEALDALAEYSAFIWFITENKELYFIAPTTYTASRPLVDDDILEDSYSYDIGNEQYRNRQYSIGGKGRTVLLTENFAGDGKTRTFKLSRAVAVEPTITVNGGAAKTVGIGQVDAEGTHDFYWNEDSDTITQDSSGTLLISTDALQVQYYGLYKVINSASDYEAIASRAAIDGTSGIIEVAMTGSLMTTAAAAIAAAEAKLTRFARDATVFKFKTTSDEFACGQMLTIDFTAFSFSVDYLITNINTTEPDGQVEYEITCVDGPASSEWETVFADIDQEARSGKIEIGVLNEADLLVYKGFSKTWIETDTPNPFNCGLVGETEYPGDDNIPGFDPVDRWRYIVVYRAGVESFRKEVLSIEYGVDRDYISSYIAASEAVGAISHIGLWGGQQCSAAAGSGIELDKQAYVRTKTGLESLQIVFTEIMGWTA